MHITTRLGRRLTALIAAGAVASGIGVAVATPAEAAPVLGTLAITPATGTESTGLHADLSAPCPDGSTGIVGYMSGPGMTEANGVIQGNRPVSASFDVGEIFKNLFASNSIAAPSGTYTVRMACIGPDFFAENGQFSQQIVFTPSGGTNNASYVTQTPALPTTTTLAAPSVADPVASGTSVTLSATVDGGASGTPTGSVQFKGGSGGTTNIGTPVALVAGEATLTTTVIPAGANSLKATYVPSGANALGASTSNAISYVVAGPTSVTGDVRVGGTVACTAATGGTPSYAWSMNGGATGITTASLVVPAAWLNQSITCAVTTTVGGNPPVTRASAAVQPGLGAALRYTVRPKVLGKMKVGKRLTCAHGTWTPAATSYAYQWFRGAKALTGKTAVNYKVVRKDLGKRLTCRVTAVKAAHASGVAKAPARKVT